MEIHLGSRNRTPSTRTRLLHSQAAKAIVAIAEAARCNTAGLPYRQRAVDHAQRQTLA
jgi:hypothetical protein